MILVDSNIFLYAAGRPHPNKESSLALLERIGSGGLDAMVDAEVHQEILHRYRALRRWKEGRALYQLARTIVPVVEPVTAETVAAAAEILDAYPDLMARDALHAAVCLRVGAEALCSFDRDFDAIKEIRRVEPSELL